MARFPSHIPNKLVEVPEPGILFTRDNAMWAYHALKAVRDAGRSIPEQDELCDELGDILFPKRTYKTPEWLHERVNDPYGTPNKHAFWENLNFIRRGVWKLFERGGWVYAYDTQHNAWCHFPNWDKAKEHCNKPAIDPWA